MNQNMAAELEDTALLAKTEQGDHIALEAKYHLVCLTKLIRDLSQEKNKNLLASAVKRRKRRLEPLLSS